MKKVLLFACLSALLAGCGAQDTISRQYRCFFIFSYTDHPTSILFSTVQNPGCYAIVTTRGDGSSSTRHVYVRPNNGTNSTEDNLIRTAPENNYRYELGANNEIGLIIGLSNFSGLKAYDGICPNCPTLTPLRWTGNFQHVSCSKCSRVYALETGNITQGDEGNSLFLYNCAFDGVLLRAWN
ncbi:MAG: hypothetical protein J6E43_04595 [Prevotella sp.]|nr:hypothetical protein [Prevotella sp.]